jgi:D-arabinose 1-dehydrogenase-like Zn-dependent alcohol dehydrogenase
MGIRSYSTSEANNIQLGQAGADYVTNGTVNSDTYIAIQALSVDCVISATSSDTDVWDTLSSITVKAGQTIYGRWSAVTVASGDFAMVYRG